MKTIEAIISMMVLLSFASLTLIQVPQAEPSLHKYQLAEDIWRIAYLKGCFSQSMFNEKFSLDSAAITSALESKKGADQAIISVMERSLSTAALADPTDEMEECLNPLFDEINQQTSLNIAFDAPLEVAAGDSLPGEEAVVIHKALVLNGVPQRVALKVE